MGPPKQTLHVFLSRFAQRDIKKGHDNFFSCGVQDGKVVATVYAPVFFNKEITGKPCETQTQAECSAAHAFWKKLTLLKWKWVPPALNYDKQLHVLRITCPPAPVMTAGVIVIGSEYSGQMAHCGGHGWDDQWWKEGARLPRTSGVHHLSLQPKAPPASACTFGCASLARTSSGDRYTNYTSKESRALGGIKVFGFEGMQACSVVLSRLSRLREGRPQEVLQEACGKSAEEEAIIPLQSAD